MKNQLISFVDKSGLHRPRFASFSRVEVKITTRPATMKIMTKITEILFLPPIEFVPSSRSR